MKCKNSTTQMLLQVLALLCSMCNVKGTTATAAFAASTGIQRQQQPTTTQQRYAGITRVGESEQSQSSRLKCVLPKPRRMSSLGASSTSESTSAQSMKENDKVRYFSISWTLELCSLQNEKEQPIDCKIISPLVSVFHLVEFLQTFCN